MVCRANVRIPCDFVTETVVLSDQTAGLHVLLRIGAGVGRSALAALDKYSCAMTETRAESWPSKW